MSPRLERFLSFAIVLAAVAFALEPGRRPTARGADAPEDVFSAERAMAHVRALTTGPRLVNTPLHARAQTYIRRELEEMGLEVRVEKTYPINILGRLPGQGRTGRALLLAAHYDSVARGPGAGDDAAGCAAILEAVRALRTGPPLHNDLLVLIDDGEERGLLGAKAFVKTPDARAVAAALNFEARGNAGPSYMFETSTPNARLVALLAHAAPDPFASSLAAGVYALLPNDTDFTVFKRAGIAGLNFAFIEGFRAYHTEHDTAEGLDHRSLQQHGDYALSMARAVGNADLAEVLDPAAGDAIFFPVSRTLIVHPASWAWPLAIAFSLAAIGAAVRARKGLLRALAYLLLEVLAVAIVFLVVGQTATYGMGQHTHGWFGGTWHDPAWFAAMAGIAAYGVLRGSARLKLAPDGLAAAGLLLHVPALLAAAALLPGATFLAWPLIPLAIALAARPRPIVYALAAVPLALVLAPCLEGLFAAATLTMAFVVAVPLAPAVALLAPLLAKAEPVG
jgi:hypothetical protein